MPYYRSQYRNRRYGYRKRRYRSRRYGYFGKAGSDAQKAVRMAGKALSLMNVEYKHHDVQISATGVSTTPIITELTNLSQGDTSSTRDGDSIKATAIMLRGICAISPVASTSQYRVMLVQDKQTNGALFTPADLLEDTTAGDNLISPLNLDNKYRFRVLYDKLHTLSVNGGNESIKWSKYINLNQHFRYGSNAGTIADLNTNSLALVTISNEPTNTPNQTVYSRLRYVDN